jgi:hypothetical protein
VAHVVDDRPAEAICVGEIGTQQPDIDALVRLLSVTSRRVRTSEQAKTRRRCGRCSSPGPCQRDRSAPRNRAHLGTSRGRKAAGRC